MDSKTTYQPPKLPGKILSWICKSDLLEEIEGDLWEHYQILRAEKPRWKAQLGYWFHTFHFLRPFALKGIGHPESSGLNSIIMYKSYFKFAMRNMWRQKMHTAFNLIGLVLAFVVCSFIFLHLRSELSYDSFHEHSEDIYRVAWMNENPQTRTPHPMAQAMVSDFPQVQAAVSLSPIYGSGLTRLNIQITNEENNISFEEPNGFFADSTFFDVFDFKFMQGNPETAMKQPNGIVMTASMAYRYFGDDEAIGKRLSFGPNTNMLEVVGVVEDVPEASHFHFNFLISYVTIKAFNFNDSWMSWADFGHFNYVKLQHGADLASLDDQIPEWILGYLDWTGENREALLDRSIRFELQAIEDIHLHSNIRWELESNSSYTYLIIYGLSGLFILIISVINFVNISTARSAERLKEVGVKKTLGAYKSQLLGQFLFETLLSAYLALLISFGLVYVLEVPFNALVSGRIHAYDIWQATPLLFLVSIATLTGILAAIYPAFYLNALNPGQILKGINPRKIGGSFIRNGLLGVQLVAAIIMISGSLIIKNQINFLKSKDLGFQKDNLLVVDLDDFTDQSELIKTAVRQHPGVNDVSAVSNLPGGQFNQHPLYLESDPSNQVDASEMFMDDDAARVLALELVEGRFLNKEFADDSSGVSFLINETAARALSSESPVGAPLFWVDNENLVKGKVVGVVKDFHFQSLHVPIRPLIMMMRQQQGYNYLLTSVNGQNLGATIEQLETSYAEIYPGNEFDYHFLDSQIAALYQEESRTLKLTSVLTAISIFLSIAGLIGIVTIAIKQRVKEIGIRKILGATIRQILWLVNLRYLMISGIAVLVAIPVSYIFMSQWLENFTYQQGINPLLFVFSALLLAALILATISLISIKTVRSNPANSLRHE